MSKQEREDENDFDLVAIAEREEEEYHHESEEQQPPSDYDSAAVLEEEEEEEDEMELVEPEPVPEPKKESSLTSANKTSTRQAESGRRSKPATSHQTKAGRTATKQVKLNDYLTGLNPAQREAVTADLGSLQILAGPGSGKTKVLTTRVAHLLQHFKIAPANLIVVTFTNKAANEMKNRLGLLVGPQVAGNLVMGTFHSVCVRYLRRHGRRIGVSNDFTVTDREDCLTIAKRALEAAPPDLRKEFKPPYLLEVISKCKATGLSPEAYRVTSNNADYFGARVKIEALADIYQRYEDDLARDNALDFDDLLVRGLELVTRYPRIVENVESVLVDEFQDTNSTQYDLVKVFARASSSLTIVGDPDQSIYGWRNAEVINLEKMVNDFKPVKQVFLEENYRSTGAILGAALAVVQQDKTRINKGLIATHGAGSSVVLHRAPDAFDEATFIAAQIKHLVAHSGGLVDYGDFAILLRFGALSRNIEGALQRAGIPSRMVGGHKFFDRVEVKDILSYLQLVDNPSYTSAFARVVNVPLRGIGDKTTNDIIAQARDNNVSPFEMARFLVKQAGKTGLSAKQKTGLKEFVEIILELKRRAEEGASVDELIDQLTTNIEYEAHLERTQSASATDRWENVQELKAFAVVVANENPNGIQDLDVPEDDDEFEEVNIPRRSGTSFSNKKPAINKKIETILKPSNPTENPLRTFLAVSMLATDSETDESKSDASQRKVTLSTCHAAKGLEWPVVFVPACEAGTYPFYRSTSDQEVAEERRLLYVAITRAQCFCFLTHTDKRMLGADNMAKKISPFLGSIAETYSALFVPKLQKISENTRATMAQVLGRNPPDEEGTRKLIEAHTKTLPIEDTNGARYSGSSGNSYSSGRYSSSQTNGGRSFGSIGQASVPPNAGFSSALTSIKAASSMPSISSSNGSFSSNRSSISKPIPATNITRSASSISASTSNSFSNTSSKPTFSAFKPPRPSMPSTTSTSTSVPQPKSPPKPVGIRRNGPLEPPETRASVISNPVLVGSDAEWKERSVPTNLAERFSKAEEKRLIDMSRLGVSKDSFQEGHEGPEVKKRKT